MNEKLLIAYASKSNATSEYAGFIAGNLLARGFSVTQINLREIRKPDIEEYGTILLGTGVRIGRWYGPAKRLLKRPEIKGKRIAIFISCGTAIDKEKNNFAIESYIDPMLKKCGLEASAKAAFPGRMPGSKQDSIIETETVRAWVDVLIESIK